MTRFWWKLCRNQVHAGNEITTACSKMSKRLLFFVFFFNYSGFWMKCQSVRWSTSWTEHVLKAEFIGKIFYSSKLSSRMRAGQTISRISRRVRGDGKLRYLLARWIQPGRRQARTAEAGPGRTVNPSPAGGSGDRTKLSGCQTAPPQHKCAAVVVRAGITATLRYRKGFHPITSFFL